MNYWFVKQEPSTYSWSDFKADRVTAWTGVRNYLARNHLREMKEGDLVIFYHSGKNPEAVGVAKVVRSAYQDPTTEDTRWVAVDLRTATQFKQPVTLVNMKKAPVLEDMMLFKQGRLSVFPISKQHYEAIALLGI